MSALDLIIEKVIKEEKQIEIIDLSEQGIFESPLVKIKRKWTDDYPAVHINPDAVIRNKIVEFIGSKDNQRVTFEELNEFMANMSEDQLVKKSPHKNWLRDNSRLVKKINVGNKGYYTLTNIGKRIYKHLSDRIGGLVSHPNNMTPGGSQNPDTISPGQSDNGMAQPT